MQAALEFCLLQSGRGELSMEVTFEQRPGKKSETELYKGLGQNHISVCKDPVAGIGVFKECKKAIGVGG